MKRLWIVMLIVALVALTVGVVGCSYGGSSGSGSSGSGSGSGSGSSGSGSGGSSSTGGAQVEMSNFAFSPSSVTVKVGETVTWTNNDSTAHTVTGTGFQSGDVAPGATFSKTFDKAGTYDYHCGIHPTMTGTVVVQ